MFAAPPSLASLRLPALALLTLLAPSAAEAGGMIHELTTAGVNYDIEAPPAPVAGQSGDLFYRWVPLCDDGTGDHDWTVTGGVGGRAPLCADVEYIRCLDGTRPMYYVDRARLADGSGDTYSNSWVFWFQGGGSCSDGNGLGAGDNCSALYDDPSERGEMSTFDNKDSVLGAGILNPNRPENVFKTYNRVRISKCSYDRFTGTSEVDTSNANGDTFTLYWHGRRMIEAVLADLEGGVTFEDEDGANSLPPLTDAFRVLLTGHSGGSGGLIFNIDWIAGEILAMQPAAKVRALIDARFKPGIETEARYDTSTYSIADDQNGDGLIGPYDGLIPTAAAPGDIGAAGLSDYHDGAFASGGALELQQEQWGVLLDESCEDYWGAGSSLCRDEIHVLLHHVETPFFLRQALRDSNHIGNPIAWAVDAAFRWATNQYKHRVLYQLERFYLGHHDLSALGQGLDPPTWEMGVFASDTTVHRGNHDDTQFFDFELCDPSTGVSFSYHDALFEWFTHDTEMMLIEDSGAVTGQWCRLVGGVCTC